MNPLKISILGEESCLIENRLSHLHLNWGKALMPNFKNRHFFPVMFLIPWKFNSSLLVLWSLQFLFLVAGRSSALLGYFSWLMWLLTCDSPYMIFGILRLSSRTRKTDLGGHEAPFGQCCHFILPKLRGSQNEIRFPKVPRKIPIFQKLRRKNPKYARIYFAKIDFDKIIIKFDEEKSVKQKKNPKFRANFK